MPSLKIDLTQLDLGLTANTNYTISIEEGLVTEVGNNRSPSPAQDNVKSFTSFSTAPAVTSTSTNRINGYLTTATLGWDRNIQLKNGSIYIYNGEGVYRTIAATSSSLAVINADQLAITIYNQALPEDDYYIGWSSAVVRDLQGIVASAQSTDSLLGWTVLALSTITNETYDSGLSNPKFDSNWFTILDRSSDANEQYTLTLSATSGTFTATVGTTVGNTWTYTATRQEIDAVNSLHFDADVKNMNWDLPFTAKLERDGVQLAVRNNTLVGLPYDTSLTLSSFSSSNIVSYDNTLTVIINTSTSIIGVDGGKITLSAIKQDNITTSTIVNQKFELNPGRLSTMPDHYMNYNIPSQPYWIIRMFDNPSLPFSENQIVDLYFNNEKYVSPTFVSSGETIPSGSVYFRYYNYPGDYPGGGGEPGPAIKAHFKKLNGDEQTHDRYLSIHSYMSLGLFTTSTVSLQTSTFTTSTVIDYYVDSTLTNIISTTTFSNNSATVELDAYELDPGKWKLNCDWQGKISIPKFNGTNSNIIIDVLPKSDTELNMRFWDNTFDTSTDSISTVTISLTNLLYNNHNPTGSLSLYEDNNLLASTTTAYRSVVINNLSKINYYIGGDPSYYTKFGFTSSNVSSLLEYTENDKLNILLDGELFTPNLPNCRSNAYYSTTYWAHQSTLYWKLVQDQTTSTQFYLEPHIVDSYGNPNLIGKYQPSYAYPTIFDASSSFLNSKVITLVDKEKPYGGKIQWNPITSGQTNGTKILLVIYQGDDWNSSATNTGSFIII